MNFRQTDAFWLTISDREAAAACSVSRSKILSKSVITISLKVNISDFL